MLLEEYLNTIRSLKFVEINKLMDQNVDMFVDSGHLIRYDGVNSFTHLTRFPYVLWPEEVSSKILNVNRAYLERSGIVLVDYVVSHRGENVFCKDIVFMDDATSTAIRSLHTTKAKFVASPRLVTDFSHHQFAGVFSLFSKDQVNELIAQKTPDDRPFVYDDGWYKKNRRLIDRVARCFERREDFDRYVLFSAEYYHVHANSAKKRKLVPHTDLMFGTAVDTDCFQVWVPLLINDGHSMNFYLPQDSANDDLYRAAAQKTNEAGRLGPVELYPVSEGEKGGGTGPFIVNRRGPPWNDNEGIEVASIKPHRFPVSVGDAVVFSANVIHGTEAVASDRERLAITFRFINRDLIDQLDYLIWDKSIYASIFNRLERPDLAERYTTADKKEKKPNETSN